jgi:xylulokinase
MGEPLLIGLDAGTSATKACAFTLQGRAVAEAAVRVEVSQPEPGFAEQPASDLIESALAALAGVATQVGADSVAGIGLTGQMGGLILVDGSGAALSPHLSWLDGRAGPEIERAMSSDGERILELGGLAPYLVPKAGWWRREHPTSYRQAAVMVEPAGYIALQLSGAGAEEAWIDRSSSGFTGLVDVREAKVAPELADFWAISPELVPRVVEAGRLVGGLSVAAARRTGLAQGLPIAAAPGDGPCGWLGAGAVDPGTIVDTAGTSDHIGICATRYAPDIEGRVLICLASAIPGLWHLQGYTSGTGLTQRWLLDTLSGDSAEQLEALAEHVPPGSEGAICLPHFGGRVCPYQPAVSGGFVGLTWRHRREHLYRALLKSVAYEYGCYLEAARRLDPDTRPTEVRVIGGGAVSRLWTRIKADALAVRYVTLEPGSYTCWGAALCAGVAVGLVDDLGAAARAAVRSATIVEPDPSAGAAYRALFAVYKDLHEVLDRPFHALWEHRQQSSQRPGL